MVIDVLYTIIELKILPWFKIVVDFNVFYIEYANQ